MKFSRKLVIIVLLMCSLFFGGAILGSLSPNAFIYTIISAVAIAITVIGFWFYNGHKKDDYNE